MYPWHTQAREAFDAGVNGNRVPHAVLISGPSGCGKLELAQGIVRELLCIESRREGCGACRSCLLLAGGAHPDFREITFEINEKTGKLRDVITVGQIRTLIEALYKTTTISPRKASIIHPAERMHNSAANALLKTLEEPVGDTVLILVAHNAGLLPATVRSRCQTLSVGLPSRDISQRWLAEQQGVSPKEAAEALGAAAGRPLEALALMESGEIEHYRGAIRLLSQLRSGAATDGLAAAAMADLDPVRLWEWLSLSCADRLRLASSEDLSGPEIQLLSGLQRIADRNRRLAATPVRKDFLLRDWLIQWKNLPATLPLDRQTQEA